MKQREHNIIANGIKSLLELVPTIGEIEKQLNDNPTDLDLLASTIFLTKKSEDIIKGIRQQLSKLQALAEKAACLTMGTGARKYANEDVSISPKPDLYVKFPSSPSDEGYTAFVSQLSPDMVRPHYPTIQEHICNEFEQGKQLPFGLKQADLKGVEFKVTYRSKREL